MINEILSFENKNFYWLKIARRIARFKNIYFVPSPKNILPKKNYPLKNVKDFFKEQLFDLENNKIKFNKNLYKTKISQNKN